MASSFYLGLDLGTSGVKAAILNDEGEVLATPLHRWTCNGHVSDLFHHVAKRANAALETRLDRKVEDWRLYNFRLTWRQVYNDWV